MFNPQLDFGSTITFGGKEHPIDQRKVIVSNTEKLFLDLKKGDIFTATDTDSKNIEDEKGNCIFEAVSDPYRDELGIPCIDIKPSII